MLQSRNTAALSRRRLARLATVAAIVAAGACAGDQTSPLAPGARPALGLSASDLPFDVNGDGKLDDAEKAAQKAAKDAAKAAEKAAKEAEKAAEDAAKEAERAAKRLTKEQYERLKDEWKSYKKGIEDGDLKALGLRCEPSKDPVVTKRIGPKGGHLDIGDHTLEIPAGALASEIDITVEEKRGRDFELRFAPHGLRFLKPVEMTMSYKHCVVPAGANLNVVYVGDGARILETMPSTDARSLSTISALTDHFSGYMIAWGHRGRGDDEDEE